MCPVTRPGFAFLLLPAHFLCLRSVCLPWLWVAIALLPSAVLLKEKMSLCIQIPGGDSALAVGPSDGT